MAAQGRVRLRPTAFYCNAMVNYECRLSPRDKADRTRGASRGLMRPRRGRVWRENHVLQGSVVRSGVRYFEAAITYSQDLTQGARLDFEPKMAMRSSEISNIR